MKRVKNQYESAIQQNEQLVKQLEEKSDTLQKEIESKDDLNRDMNKLKEEAENLANANLVWQDKFKREIMELNRKHSNQKSMSYANSVCQSEEPDVSPCTPDNEL